MSTEKIIEKLLNSKFLNDFRPSPEQIALIDQLISNCNDSNPCELLIVHAPTNYNIDKLAAIISMLIWQMPDNGAQVIDTLEAWAIGNDLRKIRVAYSEQIEVELQNVNKEK